MTVSGVNFGMGRPLLIAVLLCVTPFGGEKFPDLYLCCSIRRTLPKSEELLTTFYNWLSRFRGCRLNAGFWVFPKKTI
jgi:hypothetical protein